MSYSRNSSIASAVPPGTIIHHASTVAPTGYFKCNGAAISRTTYLDLFNAICPTKTFTITIATPAVITSIAHGLLTGDAIRFTTTGALPTGINTTTTYYVISTGLATDSFRISATVGGAAINTSGTQSGTHTLRVFNYGVGDGSTTFNLPDFRGTFLRGLDDGKGIDTARVIGLLQADAYTSHGHTGSTAASAGDHLHTYTKPGATAWPSADGINPVQVSGVSATNNTSTAGAHTHTVTVAASGDTETRPKNYAALMCIKY
jgi:phage-related tail fiber protein